MLEPTPRKVSLPAKEPGIRVGIILPEDGIESVSFDTKSSVRSRIDSLTLQSGTISIDGQYLSFPNSDAHKKTSKISLNPESATTLEPANGIALNPVIAGRNFHWRKTIEAIYHGNLEFENCGQKLQVVNEIPFEDYLACVVTSEMGSECPVEFMKAQIVAARSWAYVFLHDKHPGSGFDVCNDDDCQRYQGSTFLGKAALRASLETRGEFLVFRNKDENKYVVPAYYYKTCGGISECSSEILGFDEPSLSSVCDCPQDCKQQQTAEAFISLKNLPATNYYCGKADGQDLHKYLGKVDEGGAHFRWQRRTTHAELLENLKIKCGLRNAFRINSLNPVKRSQGHRITVLDIEYETKDQGPLLLRLNTQYQIREALSPSFLPSSAFLYEKDKDGNFIFSGAGWGHGVGLCQVGALMMALAGKSYQEILSHYFPQSILEKSYK